MSYEFDIPHMCKVYDLLREACRLGGMPADAMDHLVDASEVMRAAICNTRPHTEADAAAQFRFIATWIDQSEEIGVTYSDEESMITRVVGGFFALRDRLEGKVMGSAA